MRLSEALSVVEEYTTDQWGMITTAQATARGVDSVTLFRLTDAGHLESVRRGVYAAAAAPATAHRHVQAAWLTLNPSVPAWLRPKLDPDGGVVSHRTAADLHELGDMLAERIVLTVPRRRSSRDQFIQLRQRDLTTTDVTLVDGLPVTTVARTVEDLLDDHTEASHIAAVMKDAAQTRALDLDDLTDRIGAYARRYGIPGRDGARLIDHLLDQIGATRSALRQKLDEPHRPVVGHHLLTPEMRKAIRQANILNSPEIQKQMAALSSIQSLHATGALDQLLHLIQHAVQDGTLAAFTAEPDQTADAAIDEDA